MIVIVSGLGQFPGCFPTASCMPHVWKMHYALCSYNYAQVLKWRGIFFAMMSFFIMPFMELPNPCVCVWCITLQQLLLPFSYEADFSTEGSSYSLTLSPSLAGWPLVFTPCVISNAISSIL